MLRARDEIGLIRRDRLHRKYNPDQPRVPAGSPDGGQWGSGGGGGEPGSAAELPSFGSVDFDPVWSLIGEGWSEDGSVFEQTVADDAGNTIRSEYAASRAARFDQRQTVIQPDRTAVSFETTNDVQSISFGGPDGEVVARTIWTADGPEADATVQPAFSRRDALSTIFSGGAILFGWQSQNNGSDGQQAIMGFNARDYRPGDSTSGKIDFSYSGRVSEAQAALACRRLPEVQAMADRAANAAGSPDLYPSRTIYGTDVHSHFKDYVEDRKDPYFRAERSFLKEQEEGVARAEVPYGYPRSIRTDAYEYRPDGTLCVYDLKTGRSGLTDRRADMLANAARFGFGFVRRIIVIEVRPSQ
ncbi:hypothetical protein [Bosea sp. (in: a-proteobacteria)]|uniref:hypothetical protein n=1 Tax=Bosea sp. (in: a-proteobacteria) TaxID=1871050 RepID=UPI00121223C8|nr:hypothetical protein [Bosea sp. (in: a-proteobacteria)]TAJ28628.1 MAG: hypothetical protein EPO59_17940 [Bosea sp. (in: a-proteobacteria)]